MQIYMFSISRGFVHVQDADQSPVAVLCGKIKADTEADAVLSPISVSKSTNPI